MASAPVAPAFVSCDLHGGVPGAMSFMNGKRDRLIRGMQFVPGACESRQRSVGDL